MPLQNELDTRNIAISRDENGRLILSSGGTTTVVSRAVRSFPLTAAGKYVSLWDDETEIGVIRNTKDLDPGSRHVLAEELEKAYFMPQITKIVKIKELYGGITEFDVETDRGYRQFSIQNKNQIRHIGLTRALITDVDGNKYEIADVRTLDSRSRSLFSWLS